MLIKTSLDPPPFPPGVNSRPPLQMLSETRLDMPPNNRPPLQMRSKTRDALLAYTDQVIGDLRAQVWVARAAHMQGAEG
eukprot:86466-Chlamydomonas_euryale.AAC.1